jgi:hypothetical protein
MTHVVSGWDRLDYMLEGKGFNATLPTTRVCEVVGIPYGTLMQWIKRGGVTPTIPGSYYGTKAPHRFGYKTCLGLAWAATFQHVYGTVPIRVVKNFVAVQEAMKDAEHEAKFCPNGDPQLEEIVAAREAAKKGKDYGITPEHEQYYEELQRRWERVLCAFHLFGFGEKPSNRTTTNRQ